MVCSTLYGPFTVASLVLSRLAAAAAAPFLGLAYFSTGDRVGVLLDMDRGTVSFVKDGDDFNMGRPVVVNMGIAYHFLRRIGRSDSSGRNGLAMYPCFGMKSAGDQMTVRGQKWFSRRGLGHARRVRQAVDSIVAARELRRSLMLGSPPPATLIEGGRRRYRRWRRGRFSSYPTRAGFSCDIDVTDAALKRAVGGVADGFGGLRIQQRVETPYGEGRVLGSLRADVWFALDGDDSGAWYWTREELSDLLNSARLRLIDDGDRGDEGDRSAGNNGDRGQVGEREESAPASVSRGDEAAPNNADTPWTEEGEPSGEASIGTNTDGTALGSEVRGAPGFPALATEGWGSLALDEALVRLANVVAGRRGVPPSHLAADELAGAAEMAGPGVGGTLLAGMGAEKLGARLMLLVELNARLALALPLLDLSREGRAPLALTKHDLRRASLVPGVSVGVRSPSGSAVADLRGLLFTRMKVRMLKMTRCGYDASALVGTWKDGSAVVAIAVNSAINPSPSMCASASAFACVFLCVDVLHCHRCATGMRWSRRRLHSHCQTLTSTNVQTRFGKSRLTA